MDKSYSSALYNRDVPDAYVRLLEERSGSRSELNVDSNDELDNELSDDVMDYVSQEESDAEDNEYQQFKTSLMRDDWLSDDEEDYTDEADQSFILESETEVSDPDDLYDKEKEYGSTLPGRSRLAYVVVGLLSLMVIVPMLFRGNSDIALSAPTSNDNVAQLRLQVNSLYRELQEYRKSADSKLENNIRLVISQMEKNIKKLFPRDVVSMKSDFEQLEAQVQDLSQALSRRNMTQWQDILIQELSTALPEQIPVIIDNSTKALMVIPELRQYLSQLIPQVFNQTIQPVELPSFHYDVSKYVREILRDEFQYVDLNFFLKELDSALRVTKEEILHEMESRLSTVANVPQQYSYALQRKLINKIYNANQHQWQDDIDFATSAQGTRLLNHLCSATFKGMRGLPSNEVSPVELLADSPTATSTYWLCRDSVGCTWAARFAQPLYLTRVSYIHGRFTNNLHLMNSAPRAISLYVKLQSPTKSKFQEVARVHHKGQSLTKDSSFLLVDTWNYTLADRRIRQDFPLPAWYIQLKPYVRAVVFEVQDNHGNSHYTALRKFILNAVTAQDLQLANSVSAERDFDVPEYAVPWEDRERLRASKVAMWQHPSATPPSEAVPAFGQDEIDA